jgi:HSP20 family protein
MLDQMTYWETWDPFHEIRQLQEEMNQVYYAQPRESAQEKSPLFNVWSGQDGLVVRSELPGVSLEDISITVEGQDLTIKGSQKPHETKDGEQFIRRERSYGDFSRKVKLPYRVDSEQTEAQFRNGVLTVTLKRPQEDKPRKITVKSV